MEQQQMRVEQEGLSSSSRRGVRQGMKKAMGFSAYRLAVANTVGLLLVVPILAVGAAMASKRHQYCITFIEKPLISMGILLAVVSTAGLCAAWRRLPWLYWVHLGALFLLVLLLLCFAIFSVDITSGGSGHAVVEDAYPYAPYGFHEYELRDYPKWMTRKVHRKREWRDVTLCLQRNGFCGALLPYNGSDAASFFHSSLSPIQSGCCKPPLECKFVYLDANHWITTPSASTNLDCAMWNNDPTLLCYHCSSCKAGVIQTTKNRWSKAGVTLFAVVILLVAMYVVLGSLALRHDK